VREWGEVTLTVSLDEMMPPLERNHLTNAVQSSCSHALRQDHVPLARSQKPRAIATRLLAIIHCCSRCTAQRSLAHAHARIPINATRLLRSAPWAVSGTCSAAA